MSLWKVASVAVFVHFWEWASQMQYFDMEYMYYAFLYLWGGMLFGEGFWKRSFVLAKLVATEAGGTNEIGSREEFNERGLEAAHLEGGKTFRSSLTAHTCSASGFFTINSFWESCNYKKHVGQVSAFICNLYRFVRHFVGAFFQVQLTISFLILICCCVWFNLCLFFIVNINIYTFEFLC